MWAQIKGARPTPSKLEWLLNANPSPDTYPTTYTEAKTFNSIYGLLVIASHQIYCFDRMSQSLQSKLFGPIRVARWHRTIQESGLIDNLIRWDWGMNNLLKRLSLWHHLEAILVGVILVCVWPVIFFCLFSRAAYTLQRLLYHIVNLKAWKKSTN